MSKKPNIHKKQANAPPEIIELYRNHDFVSDSLESVCASSVKITANGQITTKSVGKVGDRHIQAKLQLPGLQERCAISPNKDLYRLSTLLAENETHNQAQDQHKDLQVESERQKPLNRFAYVHSKDCKLAKAAYFADQPNVAPTTNQNRSLAKEGMPKETPIPDATVRRKQKKVKRTKKKPIKTHNENSTDESSASTSRQPNRYQRSKAEEPTKKYCEQAAGPQEMEATKSEETIVPKFIDDFSQLHRCTNVNMFNHCLKSTVQAVDDWHTYSILLFICVIFYLVYMLCYDISEYVIEERRYLAKMRSAGLVAKCFYYIMRLLKVPIF